MNSEIFFTEKSGSYVFEIPKSGFTINDENPEFSDDLIVSWTYPLEIFETDDDKKKLPDFTTVSAKRRKKDEGYLTLFGKVYPCVLKFLGGQGFETKFNFEFGLGVNKIFESKLSEIDFGTIDFPNYYDYADSILGKTYPEVPICFPRLKTPKSYKDEFSGTYNWNGIYNEVDIVVYPHLIRNQRVTGVMQLNNFTKPFPYLLFILKKGFESVGFTMKGEIFDDPLLNQMILNHNTIAEKSVEYDIKEMLISNNGNEGVNVERNFKFTVAGDYYFSAFIPNETNSDAINIHIEVRNLTDNILIGTNDQFGRKTDVHDYDGSTYFPEYFEAFVDIPYYAEPKEIEVKIVVNDYNNFNATGDLFKMFLNPQSEGDKFLHMPTNLVLNSFMPDMYFKEVFNIAKKIGNYKVIVNNENEVVFIKNKNSAPIEFVDLEFSEVKLPEIITSEQSSVLLSYNGPDKEAFSSILIGNDFSMEVVKKEDYKKEEKMDFGFYPVWKSSNDNLKGKTAEESSESVEGLAVFYYRGYHEIKPSPIETFYINNSIPADLNFLQDIYETRYKSYIHNLLNADAVKWKFYSSNPEIALLNSNDTIYAYQSFGKIKNLQKKFYANDIIEIEIEVQNRF